MGLSIDYAWYMLAQASQAHYVWVGASEVIWSEYTRIWRYEVFLFVYLY